MKFWVMMMAIVLVMAGGVVVAGDKAEQTGEEAKSEAGMVKTDEPPEMPLEKTLLGTWVIDFFGDLPDGGLVFRSDGTYTRSDTDTKGVSSAVTGPYELDTSVEPYALDLCIEKCGGPGSEWTTLFCILRFLPDGTMEIRMSPDGKRPAEFAEKPGENTWLLTRAPEVKE